jgi:hypothetical protein
MKNFDLFVGIDWSGSKAINTKSIAVAECLQGSSAPNLLPDICSRTSVADYIESLAQQNRRVMIGIDANFGYFHKVGQKHFGAHYQAQDQWRIVNEYAREDENFYAGGFFNHAKFAPDFWQTGTTPDWFNADDLRRQTESQCIIDGYGHPESPFKICYTKQVGKGGLAVQRMAHYLKQRLGDKMAVWPFEDNENAKIVMSEIYPRQFLTRCGHGTTKVKNLQDLNKVLPYFKSNAMRDEGDVTDHDTDALVSAAGLRYLCGQEQTIPNTLARPSMMTEAARRCEGWIFGVGDKA